MDENGEPAYGLIFGAFMASAVIGGFVAPGLRKSVFNLLSHARHASSTNESNTGIDCDGLNPISVKIICSICYFISAILLSVPCLIAKDSQYAFSACLISFLMYEFVVGVYVPSEGVIRSLYIPTGSMCSIVNILRVVTNVCVAVGVFSTAFVPIEVSFGVLSAMMLSAAFLQISLLPSEDLRRIWSLFVSQTCYFWKVEHVALLLYLAFDLYHANNL